MAEIVTEVQKQLNNFHSELAREIECFSTSDLKLQYPDEEQETGDITQSNCTHSPDASFGHAGDAFPGVVFEVAFSQKFHDMKYFADEYILGSDGNIRVVVAINMEYRNKVSKRASISMWRSHEFLGNKGPMLEAKQVMVEEVCLLANDRLSLLTFPRNSVMITVIWLVAMG